MIRTAYQRQTSRQRGRRGVLSMELVLTLPILFMLLLALFQFMMLFYSRSLIVEASRAAARKATLPGTTESDVEAEVRRVLVPRLQQGMQVQVDFGEWSGDVVTVSVAVPMAAASPDLLWPIGLGLNGQNLFSETRMVRE
ncbi:TadE/TadG family type IV pilus assembly protein [Schlesneria paludicola]|uniref:TadE/TadG family type IV pilus assembly protein n=1 Tax=Schlesneria paludicola TaxID=360056 RepID=UPI00029AFE8A|nr:TadE family protein [Schlesneria paludicola]